MNYLEKKIKCNQQTSEWFYENSIVLNADKSHFLTVGFNKPIREISSNDCTIENVTEEKIPWIVIDIKLSF